MSKKRSLAGISADKPNQNSSKNVILPVTAMATGKSILDNSIGESKRTFEYEVDPEICLPWKYHNRDDAWMNSERCKDLISSIRKNGQQFPVLARALENNPEGYKWEIVAGRRRWFACKYLKMKLRVKPIEASDRECAILMNLENKDRDDVSEFEDAISYRQQLEAGLFASQDDMATALELNKSKLSKMLAVSKIQSYQPIMKLFDDITQLKINPVYKLISLLEKSSDNKDVIYKKAEKLYVSNNELRTKMSTTLLITKLIEAVGNSKKISVGEYRYFKLKDTTVVKSLELKNGNVSFEINKKTLDQFSKAEIERKLLEAFHEHLVIA
ncbi:MAG: ParB/RepB/Spo0J family partition protein [Rickettsiaceae bacterium]|nr:ParB/RepB/Spo0J family partition protein [Rickettsiaceae bacterium]